MLNENRKIKEWYHTEYASDDLYTEIKPDLTFHDLFTALDRCKDIYAEMFINNCGDSIIRERCFEKLAEIMSVDYDYIYNQWLSA